MEVSWVVVTIQLIDLRKGELEQRAKVSYDTTESADHLSLCVLFAFCIIFRAGPATNRRIWRMWMTGMCKAVGPCRRKPHHPRPRTWT